VSLGRLWNGWRASYVSAAPTAGEPGADSVFTSILRSGLSDTEAHIVHRGDTVFVIMNAHPYAPGHMLVLPYRQIADLQDLTTDEERELWGTVRAATAALRGSHRPDAINVGINMGRAAGGSIAEHLHVHVVPRWSGDTNFMTVVAETRTLPEPLGESAAKVRSHWPAMVPR
jgi:ATP adenylyltransferase